MFSIIDLLLKLLSQTFLGGYISNNYVFPKPLSAKEEEHYLTLAKNGDEDARNILIEKNLRLVAHVIKKYSPTNSVDEDDLLSIGTIGLIKAIDSFDAGKGIRLATYAARCIQNEILMVLRAGKKEQKDISLQDPIGTDREGNSISLLGIIFDEDENIEDNILLKMQIERMNDAMKRILTQRESFVIRHRYGLDGYDELTQNQIAELLKISRSYVSRIETKALKKLYAEMKKEM